MLWVLHETDKTITIYNTETGEIDREETVFDIELGGVVVGQMFGHAAAEKLVLNPMPRIIIRKYRPA
jgi:hypothetical protein